MKLFLLSQVHTAPLIFKDFPLNTETAFDQIHCKYWK